MSDVLWAFSFSIFVFFLCVVPEFVFIMNVEWWRDRPTRFHQCLEMPTSLFWILEDFTNGIRLKDRHADRLAELLQSFIFCGLIVNCHNWHCFPWSKEIDRNQRRRIHATELEEQEFIKIFLSYMMRKMVEIKSRIIT